MKQADVVVRTAAGLYCPAGDFHIDPWRKVACAVVTHAHADHARAGHGRYLCARRGVGVLRARLGRIEVQGLAWGEAVTLGAARVSLHPAGHILGSAQVRIEVAGRVWVVAGDYCLSVHGERNPTCDAFEPVRCHCFVTEATFGLPLYRWPRHAEVFSDLHAWWQANARAGDASVVGAYSLGKTQHVLAAIDSSIGPLYAHPAAESVNAAHRAEGVALPALRPWSELDDPRALAGALIVAPPNAAAPWRWQREVRVRESFASGWMQQHAARHRAGLDRGFVLSDHADWPGLLAAIEATGCERVVITHGDEDVLARELSGRGLDVGTFRTSFGDDASTARGGYR